MLRNVQDYLLEVPNSPKKQTQTACSASFSIPFNSSNNNSAISCCGTIDQDIQIFYT